MDTQKPLDESSTLKGFIEIMKEIAKLTKKEETDIYKLKLPLPDSKGHLKPVSKLLYNDRRTDDQPKYLLVHKDVPRHIAIYFGTKTLRDVQLKKYEDKDEFGDEFGQEVDPVERIKYLLQQYHAQSDLFQEFLQNADDARATKIAFFLDERCHAKEGLLSEQSAELQENAIMIYNDAMFSEDDIKGIQQLGVGSKRQDAEKIGRFGAGFNCAYRYTDCPSFISADEVLCISDPMRWFLGRSKKCGRKFHFSNQEGQTDFRSEFPTVYNAYNINGFSLKMATVFRLPLRKVSRKKSLDRVYHPTEVLELFNNVAYSIKKMMVFLQNISDVSAYKIDVKGNLNQMWKFQSKTSSRNWTTKEKFARKVHDSAECPLSKILVIRSSYQLTLRQDGNKHEEKWLICQRFGSPEIPSDLLTLPDFNKVKLLPIAGVAMRLDHDNYGHSLYCSLPLPQRTDMPVSINGHFALDSEGRKNLFTTFEGESNVQQQWNQYLLNDVAGNAYLDLLEMLKMKIIDECKDLIYDRDILVEKILNFWTFLPDLKQKHIETSSTWSGRKAFSNVLFKMIAESNNHLFPCLTKSNGKSSIEWLNLRGHKAGPLFPSEASFDLSSSSLGSHLKSTFFLLHELGIKIVPCSLSIQKAFMDAGVYIEVASPTLVAIYLKQPWIIVANGQETLPCHLTDTVFQSVDRVLALLQFLLPSQDVPKFELDDLPLLVTCDMVLRYFSPLNSAKLEESEEVINLFSDDADKFVCVELRPTLKNYINQLGDTDDSLKPVSFLNLHDVHRMLPIAMLQQGISLFHEKGFCRCPKFLPSKWLQSLWTLLICLTPDENSANQFIKLFKDFCLVPSKCTRNGPLFLFKIDLRLQLVLPDTWNCISEMNTLDGLPIVDMQNSFCLSRSEDFTSWLFDTETPEKLISSLVYWNECGFLEWPKEYPNHRTIAFALLSYLAKSKLCQPTNLGKLPIFETFDGQIQNLIEGLPVFTLDTHESLPPDGRIVWMSKALFLKKHDNFLTLYEGLHVGHIDLPKLYSDFIVPSFPDMTPTQQINHFCFLHDHWDSKGFKEAIHKVLKETQFIQIRNGTKKSINQFCDHTVPLFAAMCSTDDFLPEDFVTTLKTVDEHFWMQSFLNKIGLRYLPEPEEHVKFALELSNLSLDGNLKKIEKVAKLLFDSVVSSSSFSSEAESEAWDDCIMRMSRISFIPSQKNEENLRTLFPLTELNSHQLVQANGSFSSDCHSLVWTLTRVLPYWVPRELHTKMGIQSSPSFDYCKKHFEKLLSSI